MTQETVKLRVVAHRYMESATKPGKLVAAPWTNNKVLHNKKAYGPGDTFEIEGVFDQNGKLIKTAKQAAQDLVDSGTVQIASEKPRAYKPPFLEHRIQEMRGVQPREKTFGKVPTREDNNDFDAKWEDDDYEDGY